MGERHPAQAGDRPSDFNQLIKDALAANLQPEPPKARLDAGYILQRAFGDTDPALLQAANPLIQYEHRANRANPNGVSEYLPQSDPEFAFVVDYIRQRLDYPRTDEEFEDRLEEYVKNQKDSPKKEGFADRIPMIAHSQALRDPASREFVRDEAGRIQLRITVQQAETLRDIEDHRMNMLFGDSDLEADPRRKRRIMQEQERESAK